MVMDAMRRDRFLTVWRFFHLGVDYSDKYYKIRPLADRLQNKFKQYYVPECELNYDESMMKYFGCHSCKQFTKGKPIRFGYKAWCLKIKSGYLVSFYMYQGTDPKAHNEYYKVLPYKFYCYNLFTSLHLLSHIRRIVHY